MFSQGGMGGMEIVVKHLHVAADMADRGAPMGHVYHSVDIDPVCQRVLLNHDPCHVFKDLLQFLQLPARLAVQRVMAERDAQMQQLTSLGDRATTQKEKQDVKNQMKQLGDQLLQNLMRCMDSFCPDKLFDENVACAKHDVACGCSLFGPDRDATSLDPKEYYMAGTSCTDWSSMGDGKSLAGNTVLPFAVELQLIKFRRPRVFFHECTRNFKPQILSQYLEGCFVLLHISF